MSSARERFERRARRQPWGIEIELWRLVDTRTYPNEAERLPLSYIFAEDTRSNAHPASPRHDEDTLDNQGDESTLEEVLEHDSSEPEKGTDAGGKS
jgi:hypothetical protein